LLRSVCWVGVGISEALLDWKDFGQAIKGAVWQCGEVGCRLEFTCLRRRWVCYVVMQGFVIGGVDDAVVRYSVRALRNPWPSHALDARHAGIRKDLCAAAMEVR
jgi:hypothetical protein